MSSPTAYMTMAAIFAIRSLKSPELPDTPARFSNFVERYYGWQVDEATGDRIVAQLDNWGLVSIIDDDYAGRLLRLYGATTNDALDILSDSGHQELVAKARVGGKDWFIRVFNNQKFWDDLNRDPMPSKGSSVSLEDDDDIVPASDRIVSKSDNADAISAIRTDVSAVQTILHQDNEVGDELGDDREIIELELEIADQILQKPRFRLRSLLNWLLPALKFLADKFAGGAIAEIAKRLIAALLGLQ